MSSKLHSVDRLLGTNAVPSLEQKCTIQKELIGPETKLLGIRTQIAILKDKLENLAQQEIILSEEIAPYQALNSPFRRLNDDVLREIFLACLPTEYFPVIDFRRPPLLLTHISSHLRQLALTAPRLWAAIDVPIFAPCLTEWYNGRDEFWESHSQRTMTKYAWAVNDWLRRAGTCDIAISIHEQGQHISNRYINDIFRVLIKRAPQWKSISLHCSAYSIQRLFQMLGQSYSNEFSFPRLEHLSLDISGLDYQLDDPQDLYNQDSHLLDCPHLSSIHLVLPADNYEGYHIQWSCLTELSLGSALYPSSLISIVPILKSCSSLLSCKLYIKMDGTELDLCLPYLKAVSISFDQEKWFNNMFGYTSYTLQMKNIFCLFDRLEIPMLECIVYDASADFIPLLGLLHRMGENITHLSVTNFEVPTELMECLRVCLLLIALDVSRQDGIPRSSARNSQCRPALSAPLISWATAGDQFLCYLMASSADKTVQEQLCPRLKYLTYHISDGPISCEVIEAFIMSKCSVQECTDVTLKGFSVYLRGGEQDVKRIWHSVKVQLLAGLCLQLIPGRTAPKLMPVTVYPITGQPRWWDDG